MRLIWCRPNILATASLSINLRKLSPNWPMIVLAPPYPGPPLFMAFIREVSPLFGMCQGYLMIKQEKQRTMYKWISQYTEQLFMEHWQAFTAKHGHFIRSVWENIYIYNFDENTILNNVIFICLFDLNGSIIWHIILSLHWCYCACI